MQEITRYNNWGSILNSCSNETKEHIQPYNLQINGLPISNKLIHFNNEEYALTLINKSLENSSRKYNIQFIPKLIKIPIHIICCFIEEDTIEIYKVLAVEGIKINIGNVYVINDIFLEVLTYNKISDLEYLTVDGLNKVCSRLGIYKSGLRGKLMEIVLNKIIEINNSSEIKYVYVDNEVNINEKLALYNENLSVIGNKHNHFTNIDDKIGIKKRGKCVIPVGLKTM